jgi:hypothetical protein
MVALALLASTDRAMDRRANGQGEDIDDK